MKFYFPIHLDGGNRGCEGIAKGTSFILNERCDNLTGLCTNVELDRKLGVEDYITLQAPNKPSIPSRIRYHICKPFISDDNIRQLEYKMFYDRFLRQITPKDMMLSTGGDMMCYEENQVIYTNNYLHSKGVRTGLWGCSMGPENLTPAKEETLRNFTFVYARESMTYDYFKNLGLKQVYCFPDPAFVLDPEVCVLPSYFCKSTIGINISNYVIGDYTLDKSFGKQVRNVIKFILNETDYNICLIPHVTWCDQDDRKVAMNIKSLFPDDDRIQILDISQLNYCQIRYIISHCCFFIGARTHAVISAYSTCVPTIALGYSVKSIGIARDLMLSEQLVVDSRNSSKDNALLESFSYMLKNETQIRTHLESIMPEYRKKAYHAREIIGNI